MPLSLNPYYGGAARTQIHTDESKSLDLPK
jgi:hypothetical protein